MRVELTETGAPTRTLVIGARAYDDGVAFRYLVPEQANAKQFRLVDEKTEFRIARDCFSYPIFLESFRTSYERRYSMLPISGILDDRHTALPLLIDLPGVAWMAITEADLNDYAGLYLRRNVKNVDNAFAAEHPPHPDDANLKVIAPTPHNSPWRATMISPEVGRLVESNIVINLNPPQAFEDASWVKAGKSAWDWWFGRIETDRGFRTAMNTETFLYLIDFASDANFEYVLVDAGWSAQGDITKPNPRFDMQKVISYAESKGLKIWL